MKNYLLSLFNGLINVALAFFIGWFCKGTLMEIALLYYLIGLMDRTFIIMENNGY